MTNSARFMRCALQVNASTYAKKYRGKDHGFDAASYAEELGKICNEENISVVGIADHGNVSEIDLIQKKLNERGIVVFPGFEVATAEKIHWVCLFPENTSSESLHRYLGSLKLTDPNDGVRPSELSSAQLLDIVEDLNGFCFAAHVTDNNGLLKAKLNQVWQNKLLKAVQIPDLPDDPSLDDFYKRVLQNTDPHYRRDRLPAFINAKDVEAPETLHDSKASTWIKMTKPCFESFITAFKDPESRIRLGRDLEEIHYSRIEQIEFEEGFLAGIKIELSNHLNTIIGGRGTGKSTLIQCIRYALDMPPNTKEAYKQYDEIVKANLTGGGRIKLRIKSKAMHGKVYSISRRYGELPIITDELGDVSQLKPRDLLPRIEIYGQNEIYELARDPMSLSMIINRFLSNDNDYDEKISETKKKLATNRQQLVDIYEKIDDLTGSVNKLPKLLEQAEEFKKLHIEEKLKLVPLLEKERAFAKTANEKSKEFEAVVSKFELSLPDLSMLVVSEDFPHLSEVVALKEVLENCKKVILNKTGEIKQEISAMIANFQPEAAKLQQSLMTAEASLKEIFDSLPTLAGKSGQELGTTYQNVLREIENIRSSEEKVKGHNLTIMDLEQERRNLLKEFSDLRNERTSEFQKTVRKISQRLERKVKLSISAGENRVQLKEFLLSMPGIGEKKIAWIDEVGEELTISTLVAAIQKGDKALQELSWGLTTSLVSELCNLTKDRLLALEEIDLKDHVLIELNVSHQSIQFKPLNKLSIGQQCTAILNLLLLDNDDPLIMDQPEDNLDNSFIAERIVSQLRSAKTTRQFIFATHNANLPVFGDAEWIGIFSSNDSNAEMPEEAQGSIDIPNIREKVAEILEGGREAFTQRKEKYGF